MSAGSRSIMHTEKKHKNRCNRDLEIQQGSGGCRGTRAWKISLSAAVHELSC